MGSSEQILWGVPFDLARRHPQAKNGLGASDMNVLLTTPQPPVLVVGGVIRAIVAIRCHYRLEQPGVASPISRRLDDG